MMNSRNLILDNAIEARPDHPAAWPAPKRCQRQEVLPLFLVVNGGFERGSFTGWTQFPGSSGSYFGVGSSSVHSGSHATYFGATGSANDSIAQPLPTAAGQSYTIRCPDRPGTLVLLLAAL
jgi:hypothetical protein